MLCSSETEIVLPAHSLLPARDISRARRGSERRESLRGLAGEGSREGPYGRTQPRAARAPAPSMGTGGMPGHTDAAASREAELKPPQHPPVLPLCWGRARVRISLGSVEILPAVAS